MGRAVRVKAETEMVAQGKGEMGRVVKVKAAGEGWGKVA